MTNDDIARLRALAAGATRGPWKWDGVPLHDGSAEEGDIRVDDDDKIEWVLTGSVHCPAMAKAADAAFIAAAREALPAALDEIERLRAALTDLEDRAKSRRGISPREVEVLARRALAGGQ